MKENKKSDNQKNKGETVDRPSDCKGLRIVTRLIILFVTAAAVIAFMLIGSCSLVVRFYHIPAPAPVYTAEKAPDTVRIAALTDLHGWMIGENQGKIVGRVQEIWPDLIVCLGDMVDRSRAEESETALVVLVKQLTAIAPVYYVDEDIRPEGMEPESMEPEAAAVGKALDKGASDRKGSVVNLCGITTHYYWGEAEYALVDHLRHMDGINILLCHYPESVLWYDAFERGGLDAALCGHTHGGLIRLPFVGGVFSPEQGWWPRYDQGAYPVYTDTDKRNYGGGEGSQYLGTMIISAGLAGEHGVPRINNPKEISVVEIIRDQQIPDE